MNNTIPLVMIHGLLGSIDYFSPAAYFKGIAVHTPDLLGYGLHSAAAQPLTLQMQARHVAQYIKSQVGCPSYVLGHSVGGAVAALLAKLEPELVKGVISVEGNFTLNDAFWCRKIAPMKESDWTIEYARLQSRPDAWLADSGVEPTPERVAWARRMLGNQPPTTVQAMARAVVNETATPGFLEGMKTIVDKGLPVYLLAGEKSVGGWDVPQWVKAAAKGNVILPGVGHMMMLEQPEQFCSAVSAMMRS